MHPSCWGAPRPVPLGARGFWVRAEAGPSLVLGRDLGSSATLASFSSFRPSFLIDLDLFPAAASPFPSGGTPVLLFELSARVWGDK